MLKSITVQNFAYYKDRQTLTFEDGAYYLIGENDSGKTSLFEIIRGCMSASKITHLTRPHDRDKPSFALCCFQAGPEKQRVMSAIIRWKAGHETYLKLIYVRKTESEREPDILEAEYQIGDHDWQPISFESSEDNRSGLLKELNKPLEDISGDQIVTIFEQCVKSKSGTPGEAGKSGTNACEAQLKKYVNKATVVTFPMRGISSCQWTESKSLKPPGQTEYSEEIITWYLTNTDTYSSEEMEKEKEYFRLITNNSGVDFSYEGDTLVVKNAAFQDQESSILTISEGIYEAKKISVLLAVKRFQTVCLEEPDRGMHPQMIERIRDLVLPQVNPDKVVLITTHHPSFISPSTLPRVYKFRRRFEDNDPRCIATVKLLFSEEDNTGNKCKPQTKEDKTKENECDTPQTLYERETKGACGDEKENPCTSKEKQTTKRKKKQGKHEYGVESKRLDTSGASLEMETPDASKGKQANKKKNNKRKNKKDQGEEHVDKTVRLVTSGASPLLFFATKLLLVEGQGDYIFMFHLRQVLMTRTKLLERFIESVQPSSPAETISIEEMKQFLCSLHIVPMIGEANKDKYRKLCKQMETLAFFLMDKDALTNNIPGHTPGNKSPRDFLEMFEIDHSETMCTSVRHDVSVLEHYRLFIWNGTIERAAASLAEKRGNEALLGVYAKNNVKLEYNKLKKGEKPELKIFSNKQLTNKNIRTVVEEIVDVSKGDRESEFHRLIMFLMKMRNHSFETQLR